LGKSEEEVDEPDVAALGRLDRSCIVLGALSELAGFFVRGWFIITGETQKIMIFYSVMGLSLVV